MTHLNFPPFIVELPQRTVVFSGGKAENGCKTLLIVDDDTSARLLLRFAFQPDSYQILEAADGETALTLCHTSQPDLILLNSTLPHTDGITVLQQIRQINQRSIILMISAINMRGWIDQAFAHGADGFIAKPFSLLALRQMIAQLLTQSAGKHPCVDAHLFVPYEGKSLDASRPVAHSRNQVRGQE